MFEWDTSLCQLHVFYHGRATCCPLWSVVWACEVRPQCFSADTGVAASDEQPDWGVCTHGEDVPTPMLAKQPQGPFVRLGAHWHAHQSGEMADWGVPWTHSYLCHIKVSTSYLPGWGWGVSLAITVHSRGVFEMHGNDQFWARYTTYVDLYSGIFVCLWYIYYIKLNFGGSKLSASVPCVWCACVPGMAWVAVGVTQLSVLPGINSKLRGR